MWLGGWELADLMWVYHIIHFDDFWSTDRKGFILCLEKLSTLFSGSVDSNMNLFILISIGE
jgi:hypothetical protein